MFSNRHAEYLDLRPSANPLLDALAERLRLLAQNVVLQPAGPGPWTAYYLEDKLLALARPASTGTAGSIEIALLPVEMAVVADEARDLDEPRFAEALARAVQLGPTTPSRTAAGWGSGYSSDGLGALLLLVDAAINVGSWVSERRRERGVAAAARTESELAILSAARQEANRRANSLTIGCLGAIGVGFVATFAVIWVGAWLVAAGLSPGVAAALWLLLVIVPWLAFRRVRRRYPSPPQRPIDRLGRNLVLLIFALVVGLIVYGLFRSGT